MAPTAIARAAGSSPLSAPDRAAATGIGLFCFARRAAANALSWPLMCQWLHTLIEMSGLPSGLPKASCTFLFCAIMSILICRSAEVNVQIGKSRPGKIPAHRPLFCRFKLRRAAPKISCEVRNPFAYPIGITATPTTWPNQK